MGFLSDIVGGIGKFVGGVFGLPQAPTPAPTAAVPQPLATAQPGPTPFQRVLESPFVTGPLAPGFQLARRAGALVGPGLAQVAGAISPAAGGVAMLRGGNGQFVRQTLVNTIDLQSGQIVRQEVLKGAPFLMNNDIRKLRGIAKKVSKANSRIPRRTTKQSVSAALTEATVQQALQLVRTGGARALCPPS